VTADRLPNPYCDESAAVAQCLQALGDSLDWPKVAASAMPWVQAVRDNPPPFWAMESLLKEYPISSAEGLALMRLAEALLRIPDTQTAIALAADQLGRADFDADKHGVMATLSQQAIAMSKKFLPDGEGSGLIGKLGAKTVVAATMRAVALLGRQFVLGQSIGDALAEAQAQRAKLPNLRFSYDMLGEGARTEVDAQHYLSAYANAIQTIANNQARMPAIAQNSSLKQVPEHHQDGISIKLSALHPRYEWSQADRVMAELVPRVWGLCAQAAQAQMNLTIDAEEVDRLEISLDVLEALIVKMKEEAPQWRGLGLAMQAYGTRSLALVGHVAALARKHGVQLMCRLVKGAYWDAEVKRAQELGLPHYPVFTHKHHTDVSYLACAKALLAASDVIYPQFATHNAGTIAAIAQMAHAAGLQPGAHYELQRLHGMGEGTYREVLKDPRVTCRVYAPVGTHKDLLAYLVRRLLENGANASFVHQLADESVKPDALLLSPLRMEHASALPLPVDLFRAAAWAQRSARRNSAGLDLAVREMRAPIEAALRSVDAQLAALQAPHDDATAAQAAVARAHAGLPAWAGTPVAQRAAALERAADLMEARMPEMCALLIAEAHKTAGDAVAEVREAVDFLRYYALESQRIMAPIELPGPTGERNTLQLRARGVWVAISPWNFPLAIFIGQVAAALATGNPVVAKPAEQTPRIARLAVRLLHDSGVPADALQLICGSGETVGSALVAAPSVAGVVFTGSTPVAKIIARTLADKDGPIVPLIAETGGINALIADSSALPEQVCDAVIQSAFRSAGQRCSALRLLVVHEAVYDKVVAMIAGATRELRMGHTRDFANDLGPVIDLEAATGIQSYLQGKNFKDFGHIAGVLPQSDAINSVVNAPQQQYIRPTLIEVAQIADVQREIFGPVLHIAKFSGEPMDAMAQINALGFGLTLGIQTRIDTRAAALADAAHIGNVYINRNIIGAVVGVQPFGGEGMSGTGPKAGGPHYLYRFCAEQTVTINTTAAGGNAALLAG
jgi:RHH-type transcriptional regulator, proline utilization regulon repressor / proline dehydrogenase / delta 1-pyrroline-5-carboxylate dehydrogenase